MSSFKIEARLDVVRVDADGNRYFVPIDRQDSLDQKLHSLPSMHVIKCSHCGSAAHAVFMPEEALIDNVSSYWHCHGCGCILHTFIASYDNTIPAPNHAPGVKSDN